MTAAAVNGGGHDVRQGVDGFPHLRQGVPGLLTGVDRSEKERIERSRDRWELYYKGYIQKLEHMVDELMKRRTSNNSNISPDTIQAVKYAMKRAHPDNGGNADDFIRFQKCYEELTRK